MLDHLCGREDGAGDEFCEGGGGGVLERDREQRGVGGEKGFGGFVGREERSCYKGLEKMARYGGKEIQEGRVARITLPSP